MADLDVRYAEQEYAKGQITHAKLADIYVKNGIQFYSGADPDYDETPIVTYSPGRSLHIVQLNTPDHATTLRAIYLYLTQFPPFGHLAVEAQEIYTSGPAKARTQDILGLAQITGAIASCWTPATLIPTPPKGTQILKPLPKKWKGQIPKELHHQRIAERLNTEVSKISSLSLQEITLPYSSNLLQLSPIRKATSLAGLKLTKAKLGHVMDAAGLAIYCHDYLNLLIA